MPSKYGSHSFRRGGSQFLLCQYKWDIKKVASYGGWSEQRQIQNLYRYLVSKSDDPRSASEYFLPAPRRPALEIETDEVSLMRYWKDAKFKIDPALRARFMTDLLELARKHHLHS